MSKDVAAEPAVMQKNVGWEGDDHHHPEKIRNDQKAAAREAGEVIVGNGNRRAIGHQQTDAAQGRQSGQGHDEGRQPEFADAESVESADGEPKESVIRMEAQIGKPLVSSMAIITLVKPTTAPTDRSMPAVMMTNVSPMARIAVMAPCRSRF